MQPELEVCSPIRFSAPKNITLPAYYFLLCKKKKIIFLDWQLLKAKEHNCWGRKDKICENISASVNTTHQIRIWTSFSVPINVTLPTAFTRCDICYLVQFSFSPKDLFLVKIITDSMPLKGQRLDSAMSRALLKSNQYSLNSQLT